MNILDELFKFPIVMVDGENEERKRIKKEEESDRMVYQIADAEEYDLIYGEAEYPYLDFIDLRQMGTITESHLRKLLRKNLMLYGHL